MTGEVRTKEYLRKLSKSHGKLSFMLMFVLTEFKHHVQEIDKNLVQTRWLI